MTEGKYYVWSLVILVFFLCLIYARYHFVSKALREDHRVGWATPPAPPVST